MSVVSLGNLYFDAVQSMLPVDQTFHIADVLNQYYYAIVHVAERSL